MGGEGIGSISLFELELLSELGGHASLRSLSRHKLLEPPHLSKILNRLESKLDVNLIRRNPKGFLLTPEGQRLVEVAQEMIRLKGSLRIAKKQSPAVGQRLITVAATRFIASHLVSPMLEGLRSPWPGLRCRLLDMAPDEIEGIALKSACEVVITVGEPKLTRVWSSVPVGELSWGLYANQKHPLSGSVKAQQVEAYPFLVPTYWTKDGFEKGNDGCPLPWSQRILGDETSSVITAVEILRSSPRQLLFAPRLVMEPEVEAGFCKELKVKDWAPVRRQVHLSLKADAVSKKLESAFLTGLSQQLV